MKLPFSSMRIGAFNEKIKAAIALEKYEVIEDE
jgi:hypothetical protein